MYQAHGLIHESVAKAAAPSRTTSSALTNADDERRGGSWILKGLKMPLETGTRRYSEIANVIHLK
jgi:hypothetical protein